MTHSQPVKPTLTSVVPLLLGHHCLKWKNCGPAGVWVPAGGWGDITEAMSPTWPKSVNGLIYYKQYSLYFTAYRGTINLEWPGVFLFMYLFIWEEAVGTLGLYQLILLRGVFLWAEEIVCFDLLCKSVPPNTARGDRVRPRLWSFGFTLVCGKNVQNHAEADAILISFNWYPKRIVASWVTLCSSLAGHIYCCSMTPLPDTGLLRHDRACVIVRPQGHLIRPHAPQPAAITHVLDGIEPKKQNLLLHPMQQLLQSSKSTTTGIDQNIWMPFFSCG